VVLAIGGNVENGVSLAPYRITLERGRRRVRSVCWEQKLCAPEEERLFAVLVLQAPQSDAALARAPNLNRPPSRPPPRFR
jgi:hypothetical protein